MPGLLSVALALILGLLLFAVPSKLGPTHLPSIDPAVIQVVLFMFGILAYGYFLRQPKKHIWLVLTAGLSLLFYGLASSLF